MNILRNKFVALMVTTFTVALSTMYLFAIYEEIEVEIADLSSIMIEREYEKLIISFSENIEYGILDTGHFVLAYETDLTRIMFQVCDLGCGDYFNENVAREYFEEYVNTNVENHFTDGQLNDVVRMTIDGQTAYIGYFNFTEGRGELFEGRDMQGFMVMFAMNGIVYRITYLAPIQYYNLFVSNVYEILERLQIVEEVVSGGELGVTATDITSLRPWIVEGRGNWNTGWYPIIRRFEKEDGTLVETALHGGSINRIRLWTYQSPSSDYPSTIIMRFVPTASGTLVQAMPNEIFSLLSDRIPSETLENVVEVDGIFGHHHLHIFTLNYPDDFDFGQLPVSLADFADDDFFMSEERGDELIRLRDLGDLNGMEAFVKAYMEELGDDIEEGDAAFLLLEYIDSIRELENPFENDRHARFFSNFRNDMRDDQR